MTCNENNRNIYACIKLLNLIVSLHIFTSKILFNLEFIFFSHSQKVNNNYDNNEITYV